ncbi:MAG TPA: Holliday junction branch migration protein RuvA [bacterium]|nr:Holliday junction branch migration protein RuvA [bacterium]
MIARISGKLVYKSIGRIIIDVSGVGYCAFIPFSSYCQLPEIGETVSVHVHTHVREDALQLFGFIQPGELDLFEQLIKVNKIGPKLALNILSGIPHEELREAILQGDIPRLSAVPGVGTKTAERIVVELRGKVDSMGLALNRSPGDGDHHGVRDDALSALLNLGYQRAVAERAVAQVMRVATTGGLSLEQLLKDSLRLLART